MNYEGYSEWGYNPYYNQDGQMSGNTNNSHQQATYPTTNAPYHPYYAPAPGRYGNQISLPPDQQRSYPTASNSGTPQRATYGQPPLQQTYHERGSDEGRQSAHYAYGQNHRQNDTERRPPPDSSRLEGPVQASGLSVAAGLNQQPLNGAYAQPQSAQYHPYMNNGGRTHISEYRQDNQRDQTPQQRHLSPATGAHLAQTQPQSVAHNSMSSAQRYNSGPKPPAGARNTVPGNPGSFTLDLSLSRQPSDRRSIIASPPPQTVVAPSPKTYQSNTGRAINALYIPQVPVTGEVAKPLELNVLERPAQSSRTTEAMPTTVDPNQVFDQEEHLRRRAAFENASKIAQQDTLAEIHHVLSEDTVPDHERSGSEPKIQMQAELRLMIEKMKEHRAKDPALFSAIIGELKKEQFEPHAPPQFCASSQPHPPPQPRAPPHSRAPSQAHTPSQPPQNSKTQTHSSSIRGQDNVLGSGGSMEANGNPISGQPFLQRMVEPLTALQKPEASKLPAKRPASGSGSTGMALAVSPRVEQNSITRPEPAALQSDTQSGQAKQKVEGQGAKISGLSKSTTTMSVNSPSVQSQGKTVWPEGKRNLIAEAAVRALTTDPRNSGRSITKAELVGFLDLHPQYVELCDLLSGRGFIFDRRVFARTLLSAMGSESAPSPGTLAPKRKRADSTGKSNKAVKYEFLEETANLTNGMHKANAGREPDTSPQNLSEVEPMISIERDPPATDVISPALPQTIPHMSAVSTALEECPPTTLNTSKESMARKQKFSDLVDLTQLEESDDDLPQSAPGKQFLSASTAKDVQDGNPAGTSGNSGGVRAMEIPAQFNPASSSTVENAFERHYKNAIALPLDRAKAFRRSTYNPATIARDFLIAKGEHPTQRPLNSHLEVLLVSFKQVNYKTDLATFRWDLVDPGDPTDEHGNPIEMKEAQTRREEVFFAPTAPMRARPSSPPRDLAVGPASQSQGLANLTTPSKRGRPRGRPRSKGSVHSLTPRSAARSGNIPSSPLSSKRNGVGARLTGTGRGATPRVAVNPHPHPQTSTETHITNNSIDEIMPKFVAINPDVFKKPAHLNTTHLTPVVDGPETSSAATGRESGHGYATSTAAPGTSPRGLGRPPKYSSPSRDSATPSGGKRRGRPPGSRNSPLAPRRPGNSSKPKTSKLNNEMPMDGVGVVVPSHSPSVTPTSVSYIEQKPAQKPKPKRWKSRPTYPTSTPDSDAFTSFKCRWIGCKAELHNLETLRKHILKVHRDKCLNENTAKYSCFWNPCGMIDAFGNTESWEQHINSVHVETLAQQLGDGPTTHPVELDYSYLEDATGSRITPLARTSGTPDPLPLYAGRGPTRAYHKAHGNLTPEAKARAEAASLRFHALRAAEAHQQGIEVNKTAEWKSDSGNEASGTGSSETGDEDEVMHD